MIDVKAVTHAEIKSQRIQLRDRPNRVNVKLRPKDDVLLLIELGQVDVVVIFDSGGDTEPETNRAEEEIVGNLLDRLTRGAPAASPARDGRTASWARRAEARKRSPRTTVNAFRTRGIGWVLKSIMTGAM